MLQVTNAIDPEATALAACYALLLQKAAERRERQNVAEHMAGANLLPVTAEPQLQSQGDQNVPGR